MDQIMRDRQYDDDLSAEQLKTVNQLEHNGWDFDSKSPYCSEERSGPYLRYSYPGTGRHVSIGPDGYAA